MANYQSQEDKFNKVQDPVNINLINTVLSAKQGKYDQGVAQIDATLAEMGQIDSMLVRDADREYLSSKVQGLLDTVNNSGKLDLSKSGVTRNIRNHIKSALDPRVLNDIAQSKKYTDFNATMVEKRKSKPETFDEGNYQDALERGGANAWLTDTTGEVKLGSLAYSDYIDVAKEQNKLAMEFAKNVGVEQFLGEQNTNLQTVDVFGKRVSKTDLENYIESNLDNKAMNQLQINARQSLGKMSDTDFNSMMKEKTQSSNEELKIGIAKGEAALKSMKGDEAAAYAKQLAQYKEALSEGTNKVDKGIFDRSEMYKVYTRNFVKTIADNYDIDVITKKDRDNLPYEMMKDERDYQLKLKIAQDKEKADTISAGGTETTRASVPGDDNKTDLDKISSKTYHTSNALDAYLKGTDENYAKKGPQEQWAYMMALNSDDPHRKGATAEYKNLVDDFREAQGAYAKIAADSEVKIKENVAANYNNMIGGSVNTKNLSAEMPLTARLIEGGKKYEQLTTSEKSALTAEFASNYLKNGAPESGEVTKIYEKIVTKNKSYVSKNDKNLAKEIAKSSSLDKPEGSYETAWSGIKTPYYAMKTAWNMTKGVAQYLGEKVLGEDDDESFKRFKEAGDTKDLEKSWGDIGKSMGIAMKNSPVGLIGRGVSGVSNQDSNLADIQSRDLRATNGKSADGVVDSFHKLNSSLTSIIRKQAEGYLPNLDKNKAFTFSTEDKGQKGTVTALKAAILNVSGAPVPANSNDIAISREGSQYRLDYTTGTGEKAVRTSVLVPELPPNISGSFEERKQTWQNDPKNPNIRLVPQAISLYKDPAVRNNDTRNFTENMKNRLPIEIRSKINVDPGNTSYATIPEFRVLIKNKYSKDFYDKNAGVIEKILATNYQAIPFIDNGQFYFKLAYKDEDGESMEQTFPSLGDEKDDYMFNLKYRDAAAQLIDKRIKDLQG